MVSCFIYYRQNTLNTALVYLVITGLIAWKWYHKSEFLRNSMIVFPIMFGSWVFFGMPYEIRVFLEIWPVMFLLMVPPGLNREVKNVAKT